MYVSAAALLAPYGDRGGDGRLLGRGDYTRIAGPREGLAVADGVDLMVKGPGGSFSEG
jgi:hypothetical protein